MHVDSLANLSERDAGVGGGDLARLAPLDDLGLLEPLVRLRELDRLPVRRLEKKMVGWAISVGSALLLIQI